MVHLTVKFNYYHPRTVHLFNLSSQCACVLYCVHSQYVHCMDHNCFANYILFTMHTHHLESGTYTGSLFLILI